ncbi:aldehyde dehydrogenase family protein [Gordonia desulfuricans]|uniref:aldehyde dehydrogenase (NAD(+)) n=1 Tax=Gordonia desulfuricans TaxID=89051 RepID=A0A7K3LN78_9ACTN|nr:aldehyde dehydrogenase family protein [Gordonia desulfuricans]NDK89643.1 aldehyde dehydrogenase family protein [Gordonia desulfuricans]
MGSTVTEAPRRTDRRELYIGGRWVTPAGTDPQEIVDSATELPIGSYLPGGRAEIDAAVTAATAALGDRQGWGSYGPAERGAVMRRFAGAIDRRADALGELIAREVGTPFGRARGANAETAANLLRFYADVIEATPVEDLRPAGVGHSLVRREPIGVVAMIAPWNYPLSTLFFKLAPALAAGCTAVVKPATLTALNSFLIAEAAEEAGLPAGVLNIVPCDHASGDHLVVHPGVSKVAFTGSTPVGRRIGGLAGQNLKAVTLELGGKSAAVLLEDASIDTLIENLHELSFANNGQTCTNNSRLIVPSSIYPDVVEAVTETVASWQVGEPLDPQTVVGPMVSRAHQESVQRYYDVARDEGATVTVGGGRREGIGFYVDPTVFVDVTPEMTMFRDELFGPAVSITKYDGGPEVGIALANDSRYGLSGGVFTENEAAGLDVARRLDTGTVNFNIANFDIGAPFGGRKDSGVGFELGAEAIFAYLHFKTIFTAVVPQGF